MLDEKKIDIVAIGKKIEESFVNFEEETGRCLHLEIEPGTYLLANAGYLSCSIDDVVDAGESGTNFIKLDIGMSEIIRPIMYGARHPIWIDMLNKNTVSKKYVVVGHSCESSDMLTVDNKGMSLYRDLPVVKGGERVLIGGVGAYCSSMCAVHYNSYMRIAEYLLEKDGTFTLLRSAESMEEVRKKEL